MIDIIRDKDKVIKSLQELEFEFAQGNISEKAYNSQKKELISALETMEVADRVKRLQGKGDTEKPLEYWTEKKEEEEARQAREELMKKFITSSSPAYPTAKTRKISGGKRKALIYGLLALIFFTGIGCGVFLMKVPGESAAVTMTVNESAFPVVGNNTTVKNNTITTSSSQSSSSQSGSSSSSNTRRNTVVNGTG